MDKRLIDWMMLAVVIVALSVGYAHSEVVPEKEEQPAQDGGSDKLHYDECSWNALEAIHEHIKLTKEVLDYTEKAIDYFDQSGPTSGQEQLKKPASCPGITSAIHSVFKQYKNCIDDRNFHGKLAEPEYLDLGWMAYMSPKAKPTVRAYYACLGPYGIGEKLRENGFYERIMGADWEQVDENRSI